MLVHPNQNHIKWIRNYLVRSAKFYNFDIGQINSDVDNMFHKYPRCDRGIIVSSTNEGIPDSSLLASNLKLTNNDILIPDFVPPLDLTERRPDWKHVFELYEKKLNLKEDDPIVIGGFALLDCISGIANEGIKLQKIESCPVCDGGIEHVKVKNLANKRIPIGYRCTSCGYQSDLEAFMPMKYSFIWATEKIKSD